MEDSLFTIELPLVDTDEELQRIIAVHPDCDPYFIASGCIEDRRDRFEHLWRKFRPYADRHFKNQIRTCFHQRSWEMYIGNVFLAKELPIRSKDEGPDFVVSDSVYVECVACEKGEPGKPDSVPEPYIAPTIDEIRVQDVPVDRMILRITQAVVEKACKYGEWAKKKWFDKDAPFIIAINTADLGYPQDYLGIPIIVNALFGLECMVIGPTGSGFTWRASVSKGDSQVSVNYFSNGDFDFISGVLFSERTVLDHPDRIGDDCVFVNNPFARNPIDCSFASLFDYRYAEREGDGVKITKERRNARP